MDIEFPQSMHSRTGTNLAAVVHESLHHSDACVIVSHSFKGTKDTHPVYREFCGKVAKLGHTAVRYDCGGSGASEGRFEDVTLSSYVKDLLGVVDHMRTAGYKRFGLAGLSLGTTISMLAAAQGFNRDELRCMVLWSPVFNLQWFEKYRAQMETDGFVMRPTPDGQGQVKFGKPLWSSLLATDLWDVMPAVTVPTLCVVSDNDPLITPAVTERYVSNMRCTRVLAIQPGMDHDMFNETERKVVVQRSVEWVKNYL